MALLAKRKIFGDFNLGELEQGYRHRSARGRELRWAPGGDADANCGGGGLAKQWCRGWRLERNTITEDTELGGEGSGGAEVLEGAGQDASSALWRLLIEACAGSASWSEREFRRSCAIRRGAK